MSWCHSWVHFLSNILAFFFSLSFCLWSYSPHLSLCPWAVLCPALRPPFLFSAISPITSISRRPFVVSNYSSSVWFLPLLTVGEKTPVPMTLRFFEDKSLLSGLKPPSIYPFLPRPALSLGRSRQISRSPQQLTVSRQRSMGRVAQTPRQGSTITPMAMGTIMRRPSLALPSLRRQPTLEP